MTLLVDALATFRLTRLLVDDQIAAPVRNAVMKRYGHQGPGYLVECPWCASIHFGILVVCLRRITPKLWAPLAEALALSAVSGLVSQHT